MIMGIILQSLVVYIRILTSSLSVYKYDIFNLKFRGPSFKHLWKPQNLILLKIITPQYILHRQVLDVKYETLSVCCI